MTDAAAVTATAPAERESRGCDTCSQTDDHPRHIHYDALAHPTRRNPDGSPFIVDLTQTKHVDCCASDGCPDGTCDVHLQHAGGAKGPELVAILSNPAPEHVSAIQALGIATEVPENELPENNPEPKVEDNPPATTEPAPPVVAAPPTAAPGVTE